jgi:hypothetical protein
MGQPEGLADSGGLEEDGGVGNEGSEVAGLTRRF